MAIAKIITEGNTQKVILPEGFHFDCTEVEVQRIGTCIQIMPKKDITSEKLIPASADEVKTLSHELMKENAVAYRELAK